MLQYDNKNQRRIIYEKESKTIIFLGGKGGTGYGEDDVNGTDGNDTSGFVVGVFIGSAEYNEE